MDWGKVIEIFTTSEIAVLTNVSKQRATNIKSYACMRLL